MDRFSELSAFVAVVDAGGFAAAARELGQSRSSVNRLVIGLEERLGVQLLHRTTRSVSTTSSGLALYENARQVLGDLEELEQSVSLARSEPIGKMRISVPQSFGGLDFSRLVVDFMAQHPRVELEVIAENRIVDPVAEGYDAVIRVAEPDEETSLVDHRILVLDYRICAAPNYLDRHGTPDTPDELRGHSTLLQGPDLGAPTWSLAGPDGPRTIPLRPVLAANNLETLLKAAVSGLGIALLPAYAIRSQLADSRLVPLLPEWRPPDRALQVIYPPTRHHAAKVRSFTDFVYAWCDAP